MSEYPKVIDIGGAMWSAGTLPATHQVVPLDAIVIRREELPEVEDANEYGEREVRWTPFIGAHDGPNTTPGWHHARALAHLAIARHLREHPPVDPNLAALNKMHDEWYETYGEERETFAEFLHRKGVRVVES